jgi:hypothetical protein
MKTVRVALAGAAALAIGGYGVWVTQSSIALMLWIAREWRDSTYLAFDLTPLLNVVLAIACAVLNRTLRRWAKQMGGSVRALHRIHSILWLIAVLLTVDTTIGIGFGPPKWGAQLLVFAMVMVGLQFVAMAALLVAYAVRTSRTENLENLSNPQNL